MESVARMIALIAGIVLVLVTAWSVFTALVVPRVTSSPAMRILARVLGGSAHRIAPKLPNYKAAGPRDSRSWVPPPWCFCSSSGSA